MKYHQITKRHQSEYHHKVTSLSYQAHFLTIYSLCFGGWYIYCVNRTNKKWPDFYCISDLNCPNWVQLHLGITDCYFGCFVVLATFPTYIVA